MNIHYLLFTFNTHYNLHIHHYIRKLFLLNLLFSRFILVLTLVIESEYYRREFEAYQS